MKTERPYPFVTIDARGTKRAQEGHPWVFDNEITAQEGTPEDGALCDVRSPKGRYLGTGYYNSHSKIRVRLLSQNANDKFDQAFFRRRAQYAWDYRKTVMGPDVDSCRVIFGEADRFPGLTVDKFGDILVTQTLCLGTELRKDWIFPRPGAGHGGRRPAHPGDLPAQRREDTGAGGPGAEQGLVPPGGQAPSGSTQTEIVENGIRYLVDFENGQKTGFFLDQKYNRAAAARIAPGKSVLDCFTHTGSFGLNCAKAGAKRVHSVDVSETAIACAKENAARNGLSVEYEVANVFRPAAQPDPGRVRLHHPGPAGLYQVRQDGEKRGAGLQGNQLSGHEGPAPGRVPGHLFLLHFMTDALFRKMLQSAASDAQVELRLVEARAQGPDHPILWNVPETDYLKFYIFQVV